MINTVMICLRGAIRWAATALAFIAIAIALLTVLYFLVDPLESFAGWFNANNLFHRAIILVVAPVVAAYADQVRDNLSEQGKCQECKSLWQAFKKAKDAQAREVVMRWLAWAALATVGMTLVEVVDLF